MVVLFYLCATPNSFLYVISFNHYLESSIFYGEFLVSFVESYRRGLRNILCPCGRKLNGMQCDAEMRRNKSQEDENSTCGKL